jgi:hypothetical protein
MTAYSKFSPVFAELIRSLSIVTLVGMPGLLLSACATSSLSVETASQETIQQIMLSEVKGRVLLVEDTRYRIGRSGMILSQGERVITVTGARAAVTYSTLNEQTEATNISCTVRLPGDSQFIIEDTGDCIAGAILANNVGVTPAATAIEQPVPQIRPQERLAAKPETVARKPDPPSKPARRPAKTAVAAVKSADPQPQNPAAGITRTALEEMLAEKQTNLVSVPAHTSQAAENYSGNLSTEPDLARLHIMQPASGVSTRTGAASLYHALQPFEKDHSDKRPEQTKASPGKSPLSVQLDKKPADKKDVTRNPRVSLRIHTDVVAGVSFEVSWQGPDQPYDYLTTVPAGAEQGAYNHYTYTKEGHNVHLNAPDKPGKYEVRYVDGTTQKALARLFIDIE